MDAGNTPSGVLATHPADQVANRAGNDRPPRLAAAHLPGPEQAKAGTVPGHDGLGLDDNQRRESVSPKVGQTYAQQAVPCGQFRALSLGPMKHIDLMAEPSSRVREQRASRR